MKTDLTGQRQRPKMQTAGQTDAGTAGEQPARDNRPGRRNSVRVETLSTHPWMMRFQSPLCLKKLPAEGRNSHLTGKAICPITAEPVQNKYAVMDASGTPLYMAAEVGGNTLVRIFLKAWRPFEIAVVRPDNTAALALKSPFRFYFRTIEIHDSAGRLLGCVRREFSMLRRKYTSMTTRVARCASCSARYCVPGRLRFAATARRWAKLPKIGPACFRKALPTPTTSSWPFRRTGPVRPSRSCSAPYS